MRQGKLHTQLGRAERLGRAGPGGCWLGRETRWVLSTLEGLGLGYRSRMTGERGLSSSNWPPGAGGTLSLTQACLLLWQGALLVASSMGSIILKPPACANLQGNPCPYVRSE